MKDESLTRILTGSLIMVSLRREGCFDLCEFMSQVLELDMLTPFII
jgi:hypothetical protein